MRTTLQSLVLSCALAAAAFADPTDWERLVAESRSAAPTPVTSNAVLYKTAAPAKPVELKQLKAEEIQGMRLLTHANIPLKVLMACIDKTRDEVQAMLGVIEQVNQEEKLPDAERIKLHLVCDTEASFRKLKLTQEEYDRYVELDRYFHTSQADVWLQDWGEIAMVSAPDQKKEKLFILDTNRARGPLAELPATLAREWSGYYFLKPTPSRYSSGDYGGNIEVTPDGVLMIGNTSSQELRDVLAKGYAGHTALLDTSWLQVGHVDEFLTTIPTPRAARGYVIVKADPELGLSRIREMTREKLDAELGEMVHTLYGHELEMDSRATGLGQRAFVMLSEYHAQEHGYVRDPAKLAPGGLSSEAAVKTWVEDNRKAKQIIDAQVRVLEEEIRKASGGDQTPFDVVSLPALFEPFSSGHTVAMLPGAANMLVLRNHVVVPDPLLPTLRADITGALQAVGLKPHLIPDASYHFWQGQLHCGTNVLRHPSLWLVDPARRPTHARVFPGLGN